MWYNVRRIFISLLLLLVVVVVAAAAAAVVVVVVVVVVVYYYYHHHHHYHRSCLSVLRVSVYLYAPGSILVCVALLHYGLY